jgi:hypothetical protein
MVSIGRIELDSAHRVLEKCTPQRQQQALPYLLALYSFINWWEDYIFSRFLDTSPDQAIKWGLDGATAFEANIPTTWCEHSEIAELIDIADLSLYGSRIAVYPVDSRNQLLIHYPTLLGIVKADFCVGVRISPQHRWAKILGFTSMVALKERLRAGAANPPGFQLAVADLQPVACLLDVLEQTPVAQSTSVTQTSQSLSSTEVDQALQKLSQLRVSPFAVPGWDHQMAIRVLHNPKVCQKVLAIHRLARAFQSYGEQANKKR